MCYLLAILASIEWAASRARRKDQSAPPGIEGHEELRHPESSGAKTAPPEGLNGWFYNDHGLCDSPVAFPPALSDG